MRKKLFSTNKFVHILLLLTCSLFFFFLNTQYFYAIEDKKDTFLESVTINKREVKLGDIVIVTAKIKDNKSVENIKSYFYNTISVSPEGYGHLFTKIDDKTFQWIFNITENYINDEYHLSYITIKDENGNLHVETLPYNNSFIVTGMIQDSVPPILNDISINKSIVTVGDTITVNVNIFDDSNIQNVVGTFYQNHLCSPEGYRRQFIQLDKNTFQWTFKISNKYSLGTYSLNDIEIKDIWGNATKLNKSSSIFFEVVPPEYLNIPPIKNKKVILEDNKYISNQVIDGDLYISPNITVYLENTIVNGDIYSEGALSLTDSKVKTIYAKKITYSRQAYENGEVSLWGTNTIYNKVTRSEPINYIPIQFVNSTLKSINGIINLSGYTLNLFKMYVNGKPIDTMNGRFIINNLFIGSTDELTFQWTTTSGSIISESFPIKKYRTTQNGELIQLLPLKDIGWKHLKNGTMYLNDEGVYLKSKWNKISGFWYYFDEHGYMVHDKWIGNYYLKSNGQMAKSEWIGQFYVDQNGVWIPGLT